MIPFAGRFSDGSLYHLEHKPLTGTGGTGSFAEVCDGVFAVRDFSLRRGNAWMGAIFENGCARSIRCSGQVKYEA